MSRKISVKEYFSFNRSDRLAVIVLVFLITGLFFIPRLLPKSLHFRNSTPDTAWLAHQSRLPGITEDSSEENGKIQPWEYDRSQREAQPSVALFYFDPNTLDHAGWTRLGLRNKTIKTILNYRAKGGHFRTPEDLSRIYGLREGEFEKLKPYVRITPQQQPGKTGENKPTFTTAAKHTARYTAIDINLADTTAFIGLPGIGSKLAARIINFRDKLGGFYTIEQVGETFGLPDSVFQKIKPYLRMENSVVQKININNATPDQLKAHPYIRFAIARTIIAYRDQHGVFSRLEDLKRINSITDEIFNKLLPYLEL